VKKTCKKFYILCCEIDRFKNNLVLNKKLVI
jgi:hypothetical protein